MSLNAHNESSKNEVSQVGFVNLAGTQVAPLLHMAMLCALLGVDSSTIWRWIRGRDFPQPHVSVGAKVRMWRAVDVENWLNSQATAAQAARQIGSGAAHD
jgi:predicted DNA-binding transcriptional regulator AlpA